MQNKISVIIPAYNEEKNIPQIIRALRKQIYKNFEIIVVDNNSQDNTFKVAKKFSDRVYKCTEQGISPARNYGASKSRCEIVAFLDADSTPSNNWVEQIKLAFDNNPQLSAITGLDVYEHRNAFKKNFINIYSHLCFNLCRISNVLKKPTIIGNNFAIKRKLFEKLGGFPKLIVEDYYFSKKLQKFPGVQCISNPKMKVELSSRRLEKEGVFKTQYLWLKSLFAELPQKSYKFHDEI